MIKELESDINTGNINHAYFFECENREMGIKTARDFVERISGKSTNNNLDYISLETDEKSIKVDAIRELQRDVSIKPLLSSKKFYIIPDANKMNIASQNCLLKTLEEPPDYVIIILIAPSVYSVIGTVRSRVKYIKIKVESEIKVRPEVKEIIDTIDSCDIVKVLKYTDFFEKNKENIIEVLHEMILYCDEKIMNFKNKLPESSKHDTINIARYIPVIDLAERRINENSNFAMTIDEMLLSLAGK